MADLNELAEAYQAAPPDTATEQAALDVFINAYFAATPAQRATLRYTRETFGRALNQVIAFEEAPPG